MLCTCGTAVDQWKNQFKLWTNIEDNLIRRFTADIKELPPPEGGVLITTYTMMAYSAAAPRDGEAIVKAMGEREWGTMLLDEVRRGGGGGGQEEERERERERELARTPRAIHR